LNKNNCLLPRAAIWLVPRQPDCTILQNLIADLAGRFSSPEFVPHMTIHSCRRSSRQEELVITAALARSCPPLTLRMNGLAFGDRLTQALFVRLSSDKNLHWLRGSLQNKLRQTSGHDFEPHVSLLYQHLPVPVREKLTREIRLPLQEIGFDQMRVVAIPETIHTTENLSGWQTLLSCRLASKTIVGTI
jgi:2'-5' RNA ligase